MRSRTKVPVVARGVAFALALVGMASPALAQGRGVSLEANPLPWPPPGDVFAPVLFDDGYVRVIRETVATLEAYADLSRYGAPGGYTPAMQMNVSTPVWIPDARIYIPPGPDQPKLELGPIDATLVPVEVASSTVAESRGMQAVLVGFRVTMPWRIP